MIHRSAARRIGALLCISVLLGACGRASAPDSVIDAAWCRDALVKDVLSHWLAVAPTSSGLYRSEFDRSWTYKGAEPARIDLVGQGRILYALLVGYEVTKDPHYLDAARHGADFLLEHFHDPVQGGFFNVVAADGQVVSDAKRSYGHAAALLALAKMARVTGEERYKQAALAAWQEIALGLRDAHGGLVVETARNFAHSEGGARSLNPVMHMFEALLALVEATKDPGAQRAARHMGDWVVGELMQGLPDGSARLAEWYDSDWKPLPTREAGGYVDLGHQFEWTHLLRRAESLGISPVYGAVSDRLLQYALAKGYDEIDGGAYERIYPDGTLERGKGYWEQAECLHALIAAASSTQKQELWRRYEQTLELVRKKLIDPVHGGWYGRVCDHGGCGDDQPEPYHMASLFSAALQAAGP
ncbi:MAG: AGE family epimerase/isomerase [Pelomonas sp.]|nr:AGE family epimerase/isomerase [Roseateles sp.]